MPKVLRHAESTGSAIQQSPNKLLELGLLSQPEGMYAKADADKAIGALARHSETKVSLLIIIDGRDKAEDIVAVCMRAR